MHNYNHHHIHYHIFTITHIHTYIHTYIHTHTQSYNHHNSDNSPFPSEVPTSSLGLLKRISSIFTVNQPKNQSMWCQTKTSLSQTIIHHYYHHHQDYHHHHHYHHPPSPPSHHHHCYHHHCYLSMCTRVCIWIYISACLYVVLIRPMHISVYFICADYLYVLFSIYTCICLNKILLFTISYMHFKYIYMYIYGVDIYYVCWELIDIDVYDDCLLLNRFN